MGKVFTAGSAIGFCFGTATRSAETATGRSFLKKLVGGSETGDTGRKNIRF